MKDQINLMKGTLLPISYGMQDCGFESGRIRNYLHQCCGSEIIFSGSGSYLDLNFVSGSGLFMKITLEIQMI
jgi:hypothetical protein